MISASGSMSRCRGLRRAGEQADISTFTAQLSDPVFITCSSAPSPATLPTSPLVKRIILYYIHLRKSNFSPLIARDHHSFLIKVTIYFVHRVARVCSRLITLAAVMTN